MADVSPSHLLTVSGTIGILVILIKQNYLTLETANQLLQQMMRHGYYSLINHLDKLIEQFK